MSLESKKEKKPGYVQSRMMGNEKQRYGSLIGGGVGATAGATTGTLLGTVFIPIPVFGSIAGGVVGGLLGGFLLGTTGAVAGAEIVNYRDNKAQNKVVTVDLSEKPQEKK